MLWHRSSSCLFTKGSPQPLGGSGRRPTSERATPCSRRWVCLLLGSESAIVRKCSRPPRFRVCALSTQPSPSPGVLSAVRVPSPSGPGRLPIGSRARESRRTQPRNRERSEERGTSDERSDLAGASTSASLGRADGEQVAAGARGDAGAFPTIGHTVHGWNHGNRNTSAASRRRVITKRPGGQDARRGGGPNWVTRPSPITEGQATG
jgi:hypothetical protein